MDQVTYENILWYMTVLNVVAGITAATLGVLAIQALREASQDKGTPPAPRRRGSPYKCLCDTCKPYRGNETPTQVSSSQLVRRSTLLGARERHDDLYQHVHASQGVHRRRRGPGVVGS